MVIINILKLVASIFMIISMDKFKVNRDGNLVMVLCYMIKTIVTLIVYMIYYCIYIYNRVDTKIADIEQNPRIRTIRQYTTNTSHIVKTVN